MEKKVRDLEEKVDKLDTYVKNTVGYLEGKVKEIEENNSKVIDAIYQEVMALGNFVNSVFVQMEGLCDALVKKEVLTKEEILDSFKKKHKEINDALQQQAKKEQSGLVDINGNKVAAPIQKTEEKETE